jgi:hypothetical protein
LEIQLIDESLARGRDIGQTELSSLVKFSSYEKLCLLDLNA